MIKAEVQSFRDLIDLWPEADDGPAKGIFAQDLGVTAVHAQQMWRRNSIAPKHWDDVIAAAQRREFFGVDKELLADLAMARDMERETERQAP